MFQPCAGCCGNCNPPPSGATCIWYSERFAQAGKYWLDEDSAWDFWPKRWTVKIAVGDDEDVEYGDDDEVVKQCGAVTPLAFAEDEFTSLVEDFDIPEKGSFALVTPPEHGELRTDGWNLGDLDSLSYLPEPDFTGTDSFTIEYRRYSYPPVSITVGIAVGEAITGEFDLDWRRVEPDGV